jgi:hypothetical protein
MFTRKNHYREIGLALAKNSRYWQMIEMQDRNSGLVRCSPLERGNFPTKLPNCVGEVMHITGNTQVMKNIAEQEGFERYMFLADPPESGPGYFSPASFVYFLKNRAEKVADKKEAVDDLAVFLGNGTIQHVALYLGNSKGRRIIFGRDWAEPVEFSEAELYAQEYPVTHYDFYRLKR